MSSPSRLLVVSHTPGTGSTSVARATARRRDAVVIDRGSVDSDDVDQVLPIDVNVLAPEEVALHSGLARFGELRDIAERLADGERVVWNAGDAGGALRAIAALEALPILVSSMRPEERAAASSRIDEALAVRMVVTTASMTMLLVVGTGPGERRRMRRIAAQLSVLGLGLDAVVVNRVPHRDDRWPRAWARQQRRRARRVRAAARELGANVRYIRWHPGDSISQRQLAKRLDLVDALAPGPRPAPPVVETDGAGYRWHLPWPGVDAAWARVGRVGDDAVFVVDGLVCMRPLPPVIARCRLTGARVRDGVLTIGAEPDAAVWRSA